MTSTASAFTFPLRSVHRRALLELHRPTPAPETDEPEELAPADVIERECLHCHSWFVVARRPGRPRIYCRRSCRQRAYEYRHGARVLPPPRARRVSSVRPQAFELGVGRPDRPGKRHALRTATPADDHGRRSTLCGALARPTPQPFSRYTTDACRTCLRLAAKHQRLLAPRMNTSRELADWRAQQEEARIATLNQRRTGQPASPNQLTALLAQLVPPWFVDAPHRTAC
jgi:hypothetical protein